jgi:hypothetical protein
MIAIVAMFEKSLKLKTLRMILHDTFLGEYLLFWLA